MLKHEIKELQIKMPQKSNKTHQNIKLRGHEGLTAVQL